MVRIVAEDIVDISQKKKALLTEVEKKISTPLLSRLNDDFHNKLYPIAINRDEIAYLLDGIDSRLRHLHELKLEYFDTIEHDFICGTSTINRYAVRCTFLLPGTTVNRQFSVFDRIGYFGIVHAAFQDFILTASSLLENLVRLNETLVRKVIINSPKRQAQAGTETFQLYMEFLKLLTKLNYRTNDNLNKCLLNFEGFFDKYLIPLYKLRGSFIHGYRENLIVDTQFTGACLVRSIDESFKKISQTELFLDQFSNQVFENLEKLTTELIDCLTTEIAVQNISIPY